MTGKERIRASSCAAALLFLFVMGLMSCASKEPLPNIVLIFVDDQGYADLGCFGATEFNTPNIDSLANQGMRFTNFYVSQAVCSASRASLLTGCYAERVGISGALSPWAQNGLNPEEETIAELLKGEGYINGIFGKWHLGHEKEFLPLQHGFDEYVGLPYSNDMWPVGYDGKPLNDKRKAYYPPLPLIMDNEKIEEIQTLEDQSYLTKRYTEAAVNFIQKNKNSTFFLYLAHSMVHVPIAASKEFIGKSEQGMYGDVMEEIDWSVGQVMNALAENGLDNNTLVIYTSDNGPWLNYGNHAGSATPLREGKGTAFEGGVRVPCIMRWPGQIPQKTECNKIVASIDLLPTICALTDSKLPDKEIDGVNISSLLYNKNDVTPRADFYYYYGGELRAVRHGKWKLYFPHKSISYLNVEPGNDGYPGPYSELSVGLELYDLESDISEKHEIANNYPQVVKELENLAENMRQYLGDHLTGIKGQEVRKVGLVSGEKRMVSHLAVGAGIIQENPYQRKYQAGGETGLIDGVRGTKDFRDGLWQGFEKEDMIATIDLGTVMDINCISCGFLQSQGDWIFLPTAVTFEVSTDGNTYKTIRTIRTKESEFAPHPQIKDFSVSFEPLEGRYVKITARNIKYCPKWHHGSGGKAWIFADEFIIERN